MGTQNGLTQHTRISCHTQAGRGKMQPKTQVSPEIGPEPHSGAAHTCAGIQDMVPYTIPLGL
jgi:hypothetical protein